ncbi:MAG TPA: DUF6036 family nucleotidyltransferase [Xanthomonadaceae bacterium]|jgi:hypothetical protein
MAFNLREIFKVLSDSDVQYVVVGGLAVIMHGHLRATADLDLVIGLEPENCARALAALASIGFKPRLPVALSDFADPAKREDWVEHRNMLVFQLWDPGRPERSVDVFVREPMDFPIMWSDAVVKDLDGVPIRVASIRHLIALKRIAGRGKDLDDIEALRAIAAETGQPQD